MAGAQIDGSANTAERGVGSRERHLGSRASVLLVGVAVLVGAVALRWFATSAEAFDEVVIVAGESANMTPGTTSSFSGMNNLPAVKVTQAEVILDSSSGPAAASASLCVGGGSFGGVRGDLSQFCSGEVIPLAGTNLSDVPENASLAVSVAPLTMSAVRVVGLRLAFEDGWRTGEQTIPVDLRLFPGSS